jgi:hypothetical protein
MIADLSLDSIARLKRERKEEAPVKRRCFARGASVPHDACGDMMWTGPLDIALGSPSLLFPRDDLISFSDIRFLGLAPSSDVFTAIHVALKSTLIYGVQWEMFDNGILVPY